MYACVSKILISMTSSCSVILLFMKESALVRKGNSLLASVKISLILNVASLQLQMMLSTGEILS